MSYFGDDDDFNENDKMSSDSDESSVASEDEEEEVDDVEEEAEEVKDVAEDLESESDSDIDDLSQYGGDGDDDSDLEEAEPNANVNTNKRIKKIPPTTYKKPEGTGDSDDDDSDEDGEQYLQKFDKDINDNYIVNFHPECISQNYDEILAMTKVMRDTNGIIIDDLHQTVPFLTKYERARILGQRAKQINSGATPFIKVPENIIDGYIIAEMELKEKRIPFIIRRPLPNGGSEYWSLRDLEDISF